MFKTTFDIDQFVQNLNLKMWFNKIGQTTITSSNNIKYINSLENAILIWNKNSINRDDAWENLRIKVLKNEHWGLEFNNLKSAIYKELKQSNHFLKFAQNFKKIANTINNDTNVRIKLIIDAETLVYQLPIIGYFGEVLLNNTSFKYYTNEIALFKKGHFVCENINKQMLIY